ncbi:MAG: FCD domain-containing protein [Dehalococcoidia bacterium]|nr:FCD domain-containing protein [Dehalococcoidia bacterium]
MVSRYEPALDVDDQPGWSDALSSTISARPALAEQVAEALYKAIVGGHIPENTKLSEAVLAKSFGVSRTPIREALRQLAGEGLLRFDKGKGATIPAVSLQEVIDAYQVRTELFSLAARLAAQRATDDECAALDHSYDRLRELAVGNDADDYFWGLVDFYAILVRMSRNSVVMDWLQNRSQIARLAERVGIVSLLMPGSIDASRTSSEALLEAIKARDARTAERVVRGTLTRTLEMTTPLLDAHGWPQAPSIRGVDHHSDSID